MQNGVNAVVITGQPKKTPSPQGSLKASDWPESPGITLNEWALSTARSADAKCSWQTQSPDTQDWGFHQYVSLYTMQAFSYISLNELNKAFESGQQSTIQWKAHYPLESGDLNPTMDIPKRAGEPCCFHVWLGKCEGTAVGGVCTLELQISLEGQGKVALGTQVLD